MQLIPGDCAMTTLPATDNSKCQRRRQNRPLGGARPGQWRGTKRHGARARWLARAMALDDRAGFAVGDQVLASAFRERRWPSL